MRHVQLDPTWPTTIVHKSAVGRMRGSDCASGDQSVDDLEQVEMVGTDDAETNAAVTHDTDLVAASKSSAQLFASLVSSCTIDSCSIVPHGPSWRG